MKILSFFNNKGGVGKTTLVYHLAWMFADMGKRVLVADLDPQANLTSMFLNDRELESLWDPDDGKHRSIMAPLRPLIEGVGDISESPFHQISPEIRLIPGDLDLSNFEYNLSDAWGKCLDRQPSAFRITSSLHRIVNQAAEDFNADLVFIDVGPNFGAINRAALLSAHALVVPVAPDLFSLQGLRNLGPTLARWRQDWKKRLAENPVYGLLLPEGLMNPLGYVVIQFGIHDSQPIKAYDKWARRIPATFAEKVLNLPANPFLDSSDNPHCLGLLKHYRSLMPMAMEARKPIFHLKAADGAIGAHSASVKNCEEDFRRLANAILNQLEGMPFLQACY
ncbi:MAG: AAA family ATPase [Verrucomicrobiota bacterium]